jgi:hypothetical protein
MHSTCVSNAHRGQREGGQMPINGTYRGGSRFDGPPETSSWCSTDATIAFGDRNTVHHGFCFDFSRPRRSGEQRYAIHHTQPLWMSNVLNSSLRIRTMPQSAVEPDLTVDGGASRSLFMVSGGHGARRQRFRLAMPSGPHQHDAAAV